MTPIYVRCEQGELKHLLVIALSIAYPVPCRDTRSDLSMCPRPGVLLSRRDMRGHPGASRSGVHRLTSLRCQVTASSEA